MLPIGDRTALEMMFGRLSPLMVKYSFMVATTDDGTEAPIVAACERNGMPYHRGDTNDVLGRYMGACEKLGAVDRDAIVRLTSDCPLIDPGIIEKTVDFFMSNDYDYVSNVEERTYPRGLDVQVLSYGALEVCQERSSTPFERDHVTTYIDTTHRGEFAIGSVRDSEDNSRFRITLDEESDYRAICEVYEIFGYRTDFGYGELIRVLRENPRIYEMNRRVEQKKN